MFYNIILTLCYIALAVFLYDRIRVFIKLYPTVKKKYVYLVNKNNIWAVLILALNVPLAAVVWVFVKFYQALPYWQLLLVELGLFALFFLAWNFILIPALFEFWYKEDNTNKQVQPRKISDKNLILIMSISLGFLLLVVVKLFYPQYLPEWLHFMLEAFGEPNGGTYEYRGGW